MPASLLLRLTVEAAVGETTVCLRDAVRGVVWASGVAADRDTAGSAAVWQVLFDTDSCAGLRCRPRAAASCRFKAVCSLTGSALGTITGEGVAWEMVARMLLSGIWGCAVWANKSTSGGAGDIASVWQLSPSMLLPFTLTGLETALFTTNPLSGNPVDTVSAGEVQAISLLGLSRHAGALWTTKFLSDKPEVVVCVW